MSLGGFFLQIFREDRRDGPGLKVRIWDVRMNWVDEQQRGWMDRKSNLEIGFSELISGSTADYLGPKLAAPIILAFWPLIKPDDILPPFFLACWPDCQRASLRQNILTIGGKYRLQKYSCAVKKKYWRKQSKEIPHVWDIWHMTGL